MAGVRGVDDPPLPDVLKEPHDSVGRIPPNWDQTAAAEIVANAYVAAGFGSRSLAMTSSRWALMALLPIAASGCATQRPSSDTTAPRDRRSLTVEWRNDPTRDVSSTYAHAEARTENAGDASMELAMDDPQGGGPLVSTEATGDGSIEGGSCTIDEPLQGVPSGSTVTIRAVFKDQRGAVTSTKSLLFVRP
jgi:hypothetical protein